MRFMHYKTIIVISKKADYQKYSLQIQKLLSFLYNLAAIIEAKRCDKFNIIIPNASLISHMKQ